MSKKPEFYLIDVSDILSGKYEDETNPEPEVETLANEICVYGLLSPILVKPVFEKNTIRYQPFPGQDVKIKALRLAKKLDPTGSELANAWVF